MGKGCRSLKPSVTPQRKVSTGGLFGAAKVTSRTWTAGRATTHAKSMGMATPASSRQRRRWKPSGCCYQNGRHKGGSTATASNGTLKTRGRRTSMERRSAACIFASKEELRLCQMQLAAYRAAVTGPVTPERYGRGSAQMPLHGWASNTEEPPPCCFGHPVWQIRVAARGDI